MTNGITITGLLLLTAVITFSGINQEAFAMSTEDKLLLNQGLAEITSHIDASKILFEKGEYSMVMNHLGHPIEEVYDLLPLSSITDKNFVDKLELILFILKNTSADINSDDYYSQISLIEKTLDEGKKIVHDSEFNDPYIELQTALYLLDLAKAEYSEGLSEGGTMRTT